MADVRRRQAAQGFSLVELLVVIGIVAILVGLLMPVISAARARANELKCQATLRSIGQAAQIHVLDHRGYLPIAGWHWELPGGICNPEGLGDPTERRYIYYSEEQQKRPVPITVALAVSLGVRVRLDSRAHLEEDMQSEAVRRNFRCASQEQMLLGMSQRERDPMWTGPRDASSYVFNEAVLGKRAKKEDPDPSMGGQARIKRPSIVLLAMDGRPRSQGKDNWLMVPNRGLRDTLNDFRMMVQEPGTGYGRELLDYLRHRYRANVLFVDGHVASVPMTSDGLATVGVSMGIHE